MSLFTAAGKAKAGRRGTHGGASASSGVGGGAIQGSSNGNLNGGGNARPDITDEQKQEIREAFDLFVRMHHPSPLGAGGLQPEQARRVLSRKDPTRIALHRRTGWADLEDARQDTDKDGQIGFHELKVALRALGFDLKKAEVLKILRDSDRQGTGQMQFDDFGKVGQCCWLVTMPDLKARTTLTD